MNKYKKKICVITSGRADYGLLKNLIKKINASKKIDYHLSITGTHLSSKHGETFKEILSDKLKINSRVKIFENDDSEIGISKSFSIGVTKFSKLFKKIRPSLILVLGDKFEIFFTPKLYIIKILNTHCPHIKNKFWIFSHLNNSFLIFFCCCKMNM